MVRLFIEKELIELCLLKDFNELGINALPIDLRNCQTSEDVENWCLLNGFDFQYVANDILNITFDFIDDFENPIYLCMVMK